MDGWLDGWREGGKEKERKRRERARRTVLGEGLVEDDGARDDDDHALHRVAHRLRPRGAPDVRPGSACLSRGRAGRG
eukprot:2102729-Rhodomonas_salina.1